MNADRRVFVYDLKYLQCYAKEKVPKKKKKEKNLQMLVYVCTCKPKMVKCKFFFFLFSPNILKIATHLATYGRKHHKNCECCPVSLFIVR